LVSVTAVCPTARPAGADLWARYKPIWLIGGGPPLLDPANADIRGYRKILH
jgi:hypothetical protein